MSMFIDNEKKQLLIIENLSFGQKAFMRAQGTSMFPTIKNNDEIIFIKCDDSEYKTGDIVIFKNSTIISAHRIIKKHTNHTLLCKGDNCINYDNPVLISNIFAKVIGIKKNNDSFYFDNKIYALKSAFIVLFPTFSALIFTVFFKFGYKKK